MRQKGEENEVTKSLAMMRAMRGRSFPSSLHYEIGPNGRGHGQREPPVRLLGPHVHHYLALTTAKWLLGLVWFGVTNDACDARVSTSRRYLPSSVLATPFESDTGIKC